MIFINRNVSIVVVILVLVVIAGYLVWIRSRYQPPVSPQLEEQVQITPTAAPIQPATPSAAPGVKEATGAMKQKTATSSSTGR